jgi:hypothetical protein
MKGSKLHVVNDKSKTLYTIKKKMMSNTKYDLNDKNGYELYQLVAELGGKRPSFQIFLNENVYLKVMCTSMYVDPAFEITGSGGEYIMRSNDRKKFDLLANDKCIGSINAIKLLNGDKQMELEIEEKKYDDVMPLFALCIHLTFSEV